jgi:sarcosine oxidase subunit beta
LSTEEVKKFCPIINTSPDIRYPVLGGTLQRRAGTARHDAVAGVMLEVQMKWV